MIGELKFAGPELDEATIDGVAEVLRSGQLSSGPWVRRLEADLSAFCGGRPVRVLSSATAAVEVALQLAGIGPGDEVITSASSFFTVLNMIVKVGAKPIFVECDLVTRNIDLAQVEAAITSATRAIMPTHYPGALVDMDALYGLARRHGLRVIEDAALVIGSRWKGSNIGAFGDLVTFSFHPNKNITSIEGGALVVTDESEARRAEALRFHGITYLPDRTRDVAFPGGKFNLPDVNARIGCAQLERLPEFLTKRRRLVDRYFQRLTSDPPCVLPPRPQSRSDDDYSWNMFCILLPLERMNMNRRQFRDALEARGIATGMSYEALHLCTLGRQHGGREGRFPNAERIARETVTLPLHTGMSEADVDRVCSAVIEVIAGSRR
ncbi:MAG: DegT/DnrJ/EryC1/StrS aminotransferase family protein [Betaproteobacteria bacterium]|nr:MAG: DegT/DnrJ/EryC1/StrS aminotransferase family protein [Betaproteobacteria bacterium]